jgi:DNA primase
MESLGLKRYTKGKGVILCPFHDENTPSFLLDFNGNNFVCFGCGATGTFEIQYFLNNKE